MGTLIRMKAEAVNPELPVLTEQGILPYYTGVYVNRLADKGVTLTQTEINAITAFINSLIEADLIDKIGTFYPFMGDVNVPLIGNRELEFSDVTSANTNLDFVGGKLRGVKTIPYMNNVKLSELANADFGIMWGGSMISKIPTTTASDNTNVNILYFRGSKISSIPAVQLRLNRNAYSPFDTRFAVYNLYDPQDSSVNAYLRFPPVLETSDIQHNYSFAYGLTNVAPPYSTGYKHFNRTANRDGINITNAAGNDTSVYINSENIGEFTLAQCNYIEDFGLIRTTLALFNEILSTTESKAFVDALDTFTAAVGKTVSVG